MATTRYGTSTGLVEVYEGACWSTLRAWGRWASASSAGLNTAYETPAGPPPSPVRVVADCGSWMAFVERGVVFRPPQVITWGRGAACLRVQRDRGRRHLRRLSEAVLR